MCYHSWLYRDKLRETLKQFESLSVDEMLESGFFSPSMDPTNILSALRPPPGPNAVGSASKVSTLSALSTIALSFTARTSL